MGSEEVLQSMRDFYAKLTCLDDLEIFESIVGNCYTTPPVERALENVHPDVKARYLGAGYANTGLMEGLNILDLGCANGRDAYIGSQLVGKKGHVTGIDLAPNEIEFAKKYQDYHAKAFGYDNVTLKVGNSEDLRTPGFADESFDLVMSDGMGCLVPNKRALLSEVFRVLKPGGEFCNYDLSVSDRIAEEIQKDMIMWGEGFGGAFPWRDFMAISRDAGFINPRWVQVNLVTAKEDGVRERLKDQAVLDKFYANSYGVVMWRVFKVDASREEPSTVTYLGGIPEFGDTYLLDHATTFKKGVPMHVDADVTAILRQSRLAKYFKVEPLAAGAQVQTKDPVVNPFEHLQAQE